MATNARGVEGGERRAPSHSDAAFEIGLVASTTTRSQQPALSIELWGGPGLGAAVGQHVSRETMPLMRQRIPTKLEVDTASTSIGASSAMPIQCRKRSIACDLARRAGARQAWQARGRHVAGAG